MIMPSSRKTCIIILKSSSPDVDKSSILINEFIENIGCDMTWQVLKLGQRPVFHSDT